MVAAIALHCAACPALAYPAPSIALHGIASPLRLAQSRRDCLGLWRGVWRLQRTPEHSPRPRSHAPEPLPRAQAHARPPGGTGGTPAGRIRVHVSHFCAKRSQSLTEARTAALPLLGYLHIPSPLFARPVASQGLLAALGSHPLVHGLKLRLALLKDHMRPITLCRPR